MTIRSFIAININDSLRGKIGDIVNGLVETNADVRWVKSENLHITLKFLGNINEEEIQLIKDVLMKVSSKYYSFGILLENIGCFPNIKRPRIIWIGIRDSSAIIQIYKDIDKMLFKAGFEKEKKAFSPHITIGRVKSMNGYIKVKDKIKTLNINNKEKPEINHVQLTDFIFGNMTMNSLSLMRSDLSRSGAKYTLIEDFPLI